MWSSPRSPAFGSPSWHVAHHVAPDLLGRQVSSLHPGDRLDIDGDAFGKPKMAILDIGQSEMGHLVHRLPVVVEIGLGRVAADQEANGGAAKAEGRAALHAVARNRDDQHARRGDRELAEIDGDRTGRFLEPRHERAPRQCELARSERDIERAAADRDGRRRQSVERIVRKALAGELRLGASRCAGKQAHEKGLHKEPYSSFHRAIRSGARRGSLSGAQHNEDRSRSY